MRKSNVDISQLPKFTSADAVRKYFQRYGKLEYHGRIDGICGVYYVYTFTRNNGIQYFIDIFDDGRVVVIQRNK